MYQLVLNLVCGRARLAQGGRGVRSTLDLNITPVDLKLEVSAVFLFFVLLWL